MRYFVLTSIVLSGLLFGCSGRTIESVEPISGELNRIPSDADAALDLSSTFELISLDPSFPEAEGEDRFHQWKMLGATHVEDGKTRAQLVAALRSGVPKFDDGTKSGCFWPRHGIRMKAGEETFEFLICFQCSSGVVFGDGKVVGYFQVTDSPQPVFDKVLAANGVKLPKRAGG